MEEMIFFFLAIGGGIVSFLSPCNIATLPSFISYVGSQVESVKKSILLSLYFSLGFCGMFSLLSILFISISGFIQFSFWIRLLSGLVIIALAIYIYFAKQIMKVHQKDLKDQKNDAQLKNNKEGYFGSFFLGLSLGFSWIGCITPIYLSIIVLTINLGNFILGFVLFFSFALGIMIPYILIGAFIGKIKQQFIVKLIKVGSKLQLIFAGILLLIGLELTLAAFGIPGLFPFI
jgi:cytochrome c-type biogenesis protein